MTTDPRHDEMLDAAAAWALGALPEDEARAFAAHLATCPACRAEVDRHRVVVEQLPLAVPPAAPPPDLTARIMADVRRDAALRPPERAAPDGSVRRVRRALLSRPWIAAAGAAAVLAVGVAGGLLASGSGDPATTTDAVTMAFDDPDAAGQLVVRGDQAELRVQGTPSPPAGRVYQAWVVRDGRPSPDAVFTVDRDGYGSVVLRGDVEDADAVLVTDEPAGGSTAPTTEPRMSVAPS